MRFGCAGVCCAGRRVVAVKVHLRTTHDAMLHSALWCCAPGLERIQHSVHSKSLALKCTEHSVLSKQRALSTQCRSPSRHSVLSASIVCGMGPSRASCSHTGRVRVGCGGGGRRVPAPPNPVSCRQTSPITDDPKHHLYLAYLASVRASNKTRLLEHLKQQVVGTARHDSAALKDGTRWGLQALLQFVCCTRLTQRGKCRWWAR
jgi:hypothetical protein